ncbi:hypothetical protein ES705_30539 [subsurface metagenome]
MDKTKMDIYELMRKKIDILKESDGFECYRCGSCCHGPKNPITILDVEYMKEKGVDLSGIIVEGNGYYKTRELRTIDHCCYYFDKKSNLCKIHPYIPMLCYTYPLVVNVSSDTFAFKLCLREQKRRERLITDDLRKLARELYNLDYSDEYDE